MKNIFILFALVATTVTISSCNKDSWCGPGEHWDSYYQTCVPDDCNTCGNGGGNTGGTINDSYVGVMLLEPYKSGIIVNLSATAAYQNDGSGYAKTEVSGHVSQGTAATYKKTQLWVYVGNNMFISSTAGIDNHSQGGSLSTYRQLESKMNGISGLGLNSSGYLTGYDPNAKYAVVTLESTPVEGSSDPYAYEMKGSTTSVNETDYSKPISAQNPEKLRLTTSGGFVYEISSATVYQGSQLFVWQ